ncbi:E1 ubiquitin-activating protein UBA2 [Spizellomyces punctatus DAOM BR117]|uniref:Ubiquitin-activating enzyme E1-like n=1 Tax=Spizellomyces punctatus (strain DAOM BR117) TaxID=645134 RepID=A0A0L0HP20_SPIPD|nr:E1 ubiquitin-activating protein UBA2 [Spizellomyces punctatus DAOM BR117]KND02700.1 hypothetical protein SPPG_01783 [Spizellomyces punctatus DAOM BR117]|eukprot:XP_016610739.1 hypothetical protein SPPG_01783 [Spizellomyces punctatus DAOM BR117]
MAGRYQHSKTTIGVDLFQKVSEARVLMVGAGGIGCELLKNLVMSGFSYVEVVDLDTIDMSNLNRQFLFQRHHIGKAKASVARESALHFNPDAKIVAHHASIYEPQFDISWFKSFDIVLNALDNLAARRHVNGMCLAAGVPLIESGTEGFRGQVTLHMKRLTRCYDCDAKPTKKTYPVCTIRSTPSAPIHCIVWAKSYLFNQLFGNTEEEEPTINLEETSQNAEEMAHLRHENEALKRLRDAIGSDAYGKLVFEKVFTDDIKGLLLMEELWKNRRPPTPLNFEEIAGNRKSTKPMRDSVEWNQWDHKVWTLEENAEVFLESVPELAKRLLEQRRTDPNYSLSFDKDDDDALNFVTATANLRAYIYGLEQKSRFAVKEMAGNIIPAVATTNAIIAGLIVLTAMKVLGGNWSDCKNTWVASTINPERLDKPNSNCAVCTTGSFILTINTRTATLRDLVERVIQQHPEGEDESQGLGISGEITVQEGDRLLYDPDFEDNMDVTLKDLGILHASRVMITNDDDDEETKNVTVVLHIVHSDSLGESETLFILDGDRDIPPRPRKPEPETNETKRSANDLTEINGESSLTKRRKMDPEVTAVDDDVVVVGD